MKSLYIFCEGATERGFCSQVLYPHLFQLGVAVHTIQVAHNRHHGRVHRGGIPARYRTLQDDISDQLKLQQRRPDVFITTMIDLYGLPRDFPGLVPDSRIPENPIPYVEALEHAFDKAINDRRFIPYIQLHEYEALLFVDPEAFRIAFEDADKAIDKLKSIAHSFPSTEHINDGQATAPSRRIIDLIPEYNANKSTAGPDIAARIGLTRLRESCPHFDGWITRLEQL